MREFDSGLEQVRKKLLDLSKRNRLINYRRPHKSKNLKIIDESPEFIYNFLVNDEKSFRFKSIPYPNKMPEYLKLVEEKEEIESIKLTELEVKRAYIFIAQKWEEQGEASTYELYRSSLELLATFEAYAKEKHQLEERLSQLHTEIEKIDRDENFSIEAQAKELGLVVSTQMPKIELDDENNFDIHTDSHLQTLHYPDELESILKKIEKHSRSIMEVTGSNMLYLILGVLEWREPN